MFSLVKTLILLHNTSINNAEATTIKFLSCCIHILGKLVDFSLKIFFQLSNLIFIYHLFILKFIVQILFLSNKIFLTYKFSFKFFILKIVNLLIFKLNLRMKRLNLLSKEKRMEYYYGLKFIFISIWLLRFLYLRTRSC